MTTSAPQSLLSKPEGEGQISDRALEYIRTLTRLELHALVLDAFENASISQVVLAKRLGKRPEQVSRLLGGPGNWTIDTFAELLFAIDGSLGRVEQRWPNAKMRNHSPTRYSPAAASDFKTPAPATIGAYSIEKVRQYAE